MEELTNYTPEDRQAVFQRVWQRVMAGRDTGMEALAGAASQTESAPQTEATPEAHGSLQGESKPVQEGMLVREANDWPGAWGFLGQGCLEAVPVLQELIRRQLTAHKGYQALAKRVGGPQAKTLQALAAREKAQARRVMAACFLISGVRYWPEHLVQAPRPDSYLGTLRRCFAEEQASMAACLAAAESTADPLLQQLLCDTAKEEWDHACKLRELVENA